MKEGWRAKSAALAAATSVALVTLTTLPLSTSRAHGGFSGSPKGTEPMWHDESGLPGSAASLSASDARGDAPSVPSVSTIDASRSDA